MYHMDEITFGMPSYGYGLKPSRTFTGGIGDVGGGQYQSYNPSGPNGATIVYTWRGPVLATFRDAWEDPAKLNFGGGWFLIDLPAYAGPQRATFLQPFSATLEGHNYWSVSMELDIDMSPALVAT